MIIVVKMELFIKQLISVLTFKLVQEHLQMLIVFKEVLQELVLNVNLVMLLMEQHVFKFMTIVKLLMLVCLNVLNVTKSIA